MWLRPDGSRYVAARVRPASFPRRNRIDLQTPAEATIRAAIAAIEAIGADTQLTDAVVLLGQVQDKVADVIDGRLGS